MKLYPPACGAHAETCLSHTHRWRQQLTLPPCILAAVAALRAQLLKPGLPVCLQVADEIDDLKLGNGTSLLIFANIGSALPTSVGAALTTGQRSPTNLAIYAAAFLATTLGIVYVQVSCVFAHKTLCNRIHGDHAGHRVVQVSCYCAETAGRAASSLTLPAGRSIGGAPHFLPPRIMSSRWLFSCCIPHLMWCCLLHEDCKKLASLALEGHQAAARGKHMHRGPNPNPPCQTTGLRRPSSLREGLPSNPNS